MPHPTRHRLVATAAALTAALAVAASGCGGDDDTSNNGDGDRQAAATTAEPAAAVTDAQTKLDAAQTPEQQVRATYRLFVEAMYAGDVQTVCELLGPVPHREFRQMNCPQTVRALLAQAVDGQLGENKPYIVSLELNGDKATATVKTKTSNEYDIPLINQDDTWKLNEPITPGL